MIVLKIVGYFLLFFAILFVSAWLAAFFTGRTKRSYKTLSENDSIIISNKSYRVEDIANQYEPELFIRQNTPSPELKWIWYEAVPNGSTIDLTYYYNWENEINPNKTFHWYYSIFRSAYYGYPLYDIEYFQVNIDTSSWDIKRIRFETSKDDDLFQPIVEHFTIEVNSQGNGVYHKKISNKKGEVLGKKETINIITSNKRVKTGVQTWNHLTRLLDSLTIGHYTIPQVAPLKILSNSSFSKYKFARKSQGEHKTKENRISLIFGFLFIFLFLTVPLYIINKRKNKGKNG
jgi:hypothetical protein